jgi:hypothetical protein
MPPDSVPDLHAFKQILVGHAGCLGPLPQLELSLLLPLMSLNRLELFPRRGGVGVEQVGQGVIGGIPSEVLTAVENGGAGTVSRRSKMAAHNRAGLCEGLIGATAPIKPPFRERHRSALRHGDADRAAGRAFELWPGSRLPFRLPWAACPEMAGVFFALALQVPCLASHVLLLIAIPED